MTARGYALDMASPAQHAAIELDRAAPAALSAEEIAATYDHAVPGDLSRVREHEHVASDEEAVRWLIREALRLLGSQVTGNGDDRYRLAKPIEDIRFHGKKITPPAPQAGHRRNAGTPRRLRQHRQPARIRAAGHGYTRRAAERRERGARHTLHPLAKVIPPMNEKEFFQLAEDIKDRGVEFPVKVIRRQFLTGVTGRWWRRR